MSFSEVLEGITRDVKGARGALIVGMDGIIVEQYSADPGVDLNSVGAEYGNVFKEVQNASSSLKLGSAREFAVMTERGDVIMRRINEEYMVALVLSPDGNFGKGRFRVRGAVRRLIAEF